MHDDLRRLTILALPVIILVTWSITVLDEGEAQISCCFRNTCNVFQDSGPEDRLCSGLRCSASNNSCQTWFPRQGCEHVPASCGPGSFVDVRMSCTPDNKRVTWGYFCAGAGETGDGLHKIGNVEGPDNCCPTSTPTPTPPPTPCPTPTGPPPDGRTDCLWIRSGCRWACGLIADITEADCVDAGGYWSFASNACSSSPAGNCDGTQYENGYQDPVTCEYVPYSPILVDASGDGFDLTGYSEGVPFDLNADGVADRLAWTRAGSDDAWLALDRDGDGVISSGHELFGNSTAQPAPPPGERRNGFLALAEFDEPAQGGNSDGVVDARDAVFTSLRLWQDANHDGVSQPGELFTLPALDIVRLHLSYKESKRTDEHGNRFKYRAKVDDARGAKVSRWAWDVFLVAR